MSTTTTASFSWTTEPSTVGVTGYVVNYQLASDIIWTQISTALQTVSIPGLLVNRIYSFQIETLLASGNTMGPLSQACNITDPFPTFSPISNAISLSFNNLSVDIDSYATTIALASNPSVILQTHALSPANIVTDTFAGLIALTNYVITITPAADQFFKQFSYTIATTSTTQCPTPLSVAATLT